VLQLEHVESIVETFERFQPNDLGQKRLCDRKEAVRDEAEDTKCRLTVYISGRMEGGGDGRFDDLSNEFSGKRGEGHCRR